MHIYIGEHSENNIKCIVHDDLAKNTSHAPTRWWKELHLFRYIRQICHNNIMLYMHSMLMHDEKYCQYTV